MIRITVFSGHSQTDKRPSGVSEYLVDERDVHEKLRTIGLEWKTADYMSQRQVVITLDPQNSFSREDIQAEIRQAAQALENTGLL